MATLTCNFPIVDNAATSAADLFPFPPCSAFLQDAEECLDIYSLLGEPADRGSLDGSAGRLNEMERACWVKCSVETCHAQYLVAHPDVLESQPRCWYCRNCQLCPFVECTQCSDRIIIPSPYREALDLPSFLCVGCRKSSGQTFTEEETQSLDNITRSISDLDSCAICRTTTSPSNLISACGQLDCRPKVDEICLQKWYGANQLGCVPLNVGQLLCPFCRRTPTAATMAKYNPPASVLVGVKEAIGDREFHYGWCEDCACAKRAMARTCGADADDPGTDPPNSRNFVCEECLEVRGRESGAGMRFTPCPTCGVYVEKTSGCNHITCVCGTHFCHVCGIASTAETIMAHMNSEHGGIYDENQVDEEEEEEEESDDERVCGVFD